MTFTAFASAHGLIIEQPIADGRWHRVRTEDHPRKKNGSYITDGKYGAVINWATMTDHAIYRPNQSEFSEEDRRRIQELTRSDAQRKLIRQQQAAKLAETLLSLAEIRRPQQRRWRLSAVTAHPYLVSKGFLKESCLELNHEHSEAPAGSLLVPMRDAKTNELIGLQVISPTGEKRFLSGQRSKGAVHVIGRDKRLVVLVEGYATGLSVHMAIKGMYREGCVVVCFSAGNLTYVAKLGIGTHVFADHDVSKAGEQAAIKTGLPWCMASVEGWDANDLHVNSGLAAVQEEIRKIL